MPAQPRSRVHFTPVLRAVSVGVLVAGRVSPQTPPADLALHSVGAWGIDLGDQLMAGQRHTPGRTYIAGTDLEPPERVHFSADDFASEAERLRVCSPTVVTDGEGRVLPAWQMAHTAGQTVALPTKAPLPHP